MAASVELSGINGSERRPLEEYLPIAYKPLFAIRFALLPTTNLFWPFLSVHSLDVIPNLKSLPANGSFPHIPVMTYP